MVTFDLLQGQICCQAGDHNSLNLLVDMYLYTSDHCCENFSILIRIEEKLMSQPSAMFHLDLTVSKMVNCLHLYFTSYSSFVIFANFAEN